MANPKMQAKKNQLLKNKKALKQKQKQNQKQIVTQNVNVHVHKPVASKRRPRKNTGYTAPIINVQNSTTIPTMNRQVPFEVTNSYENEANLRRAREQQQNQYSNLLNQPNENIPIAMPIPEPNLNNYGFNNNNNNTPPPPPRNPPPTPPPTPPRNPPPFDPNHFDISSLPNVSNVPPTPKKRSKAPKILINEKLATRGQRQGIHGQEPSNDWLNAFTNSIMNESLNEVRKEETQRQENIKLAKEEKAKQDKEKITKEFAKSLATGIVNESLQKMVTIKKEQEKMNALENEQEREYEVMMKKRREENERDIWRPNPNADYFWNADYGLAEPKEDLTDAPTRVEPYMQHTAEIQAEINRLKALSPEELSKACKSTNKKGDIYTIAGNLGIPYNKMINGQSKKMGVKELREKIKTFIGKPISEPKRGRGKGTKNKEKPKSINLQFEDEA